jgi:hypothetical protein
MGRAWRPATDGGIHSMKGNGGRTGNGTRLDERIREPRNAEPTSTESIRTLPSDLLEPHPLVQELRHALQAKEASLADKDREIARLHVALAFGIKELPLRRDRMDNA